jgi:hypothetical protein
MALQILQNLFGRNKPAPDNPPNEKKVVGFVDSLADTKSNPLIEQFHRQWYTNIAFRRGYQWIQVAPDSRSITVPPEEYDRVRMTVNKILQIHMAKMARLSKETPIWGTDYEDLDDEDARDAARADEALLKSIFNSEEMEVEQLWFLSWAIDTGNAFWKPCWDADAGGYLDTFDFSEDDGGGTEGDRENPDGSEESKIIRPDAFQINEGEIPAGDAKLLLVPPFDIIRENWAKPLKHSRWVIHLHDDSLEQILEDWPERGKLVKPEKDDSNRAYYQKKLQALLPSQFGAGGYSSDSKRRQATVKHYYGQPTPKRPHGTYICIANGIWLNPFPGKDGFVPAPLPYEYLWKCKKKFPFIEMIDIPVSGSGIGMATVENLIPPQKGYNRVFSQMIENGNNFGNIKATAHRDANLETEAFDDSGNEVVYYDGDKPPGFIQPPSLPNQVTGQFPLYESAFMDISGQHEPTRGQAPGGVTSGIALQQLQESDDSRNHPTMVFFRHALKEAGEHILYLYREMMSDGETRSVRYREKQNGDYKHSYETISKDQLPPKFHISVQLESTTNRTRETRRQQIQNAFQMGILGDQNDPRVKKKVLAALEFGGLQQFFMDNELDQKNARENIDKIERGELEPIGPGQPVMGANGTPLVGIDGQPMPPPPMMGIKVNPWEDHGEHLEVYNNFRKSERFKTWPPEKQDILNRLAEGHAKALEPPPPPPPQPKVSISAKQDLAPGQVESYLELPPPAAPPPGAVPPAPPPSSLPPTPGGESLAGPPSAPGSGFDINPPTPMGSG